MPERFSAFSLVDRITALEAGRWARGCFAIPGELPAFMFCLVAESIGQLAAWVAMARSGFRRRPVAALSGEMRIVGEARPGEVLDLGVEIESWDPDAVAFGGWARLGDTPLLELRRCLGPKLPLEDFDSPEAVRGDFETLCGAGRAIRPLPGSRGPGALAGRPHSWTAAARRPARPRIRALLRRSLPAASRLSGHAPARRPDPDCGAARGGRRSLRASGSGPLAWWM